MGLKEIQDLKAMADEPKPKKAYSIPKVSKKRQKKLDDQKDLQQKDRDFYMEVWHASPHKCINCDRKLPRIPSNWMFHHLLPKAKYPQYRHTPENISILCFDCHSQVESNISKTPIVKALTLEAEKNCHKWDIQE